MQQTDFVCRGNLPWAHDRDKEISTFGSADFSIDFQVEKQVARPTNGLVDHNTDETVLPSRVVISGNGIRPVFALEVNPKLFKEAKNNDVLELSVMLHLVKPHPNDPSSAREVFFRNFLDFTWTIPSQTFDIIDILQTHDNAMDSKGSSAWYVRVIALLRFKSPGKLVTPTFVLKVALADPGMSDYAYSSTMTLLVFVTRYALDIRVRGAKQIDPVLFVRHLFE